MSEAEFDARIATSSGGPAKPGARDSTRPLDGRHPYAEAAWGLIQRACATPAVARRYYGAWRPATLSAWDVLGAVRQPTLFSAHGRPGAAVEAARAQRSGSPAPSWSSCPASSTSPGLGDTAEILAQLRDFVGAPQPVTHAERVLATILFTDLVGSSEQLGRLGDAAWTARCTATPGSSATAWSVSTAA